MRIMVEASEIEGLRLTFAELELLLGDDERWPTARQRLGFEVPETREPVAAAGLASLVARNLAIMQDNAVKVSHDVNVLANRILSAQLWLIMTAVRINGLAVNVYLANELATERVLIGVLAPGVLEVLPLVADQSVSTQVVSIVKEVLEAEDGAVSLQIVEGSAVIALRQGDQWSLANPEGSPEQYRPVTESEVISAFYNLIDGGVH
jgi:hypothetical protein